MSRKYYESSRPTTSLILKPGAQIELRKLAKLLGHTQSRGAQVGEGSLSQLLNQIAIQVQAQGAESVARKMRWAESQRHNGDQAGKHA
jgi:hypothetical protein